MTNEAVDELHAITSAIKIEQERRDDWLTIFDRPAASGEDGPITASLIVTRAEAERIFADRIAAHEARLKDLGWTRTIRIDTALQGSGGSSGANLQTVAITSAGAQK